MASSDDFSEEELAILRPLFQSSGRDYIAQFRATLAGVKDGACDEETLEILHRSIHSLKGAALQLGYLHVGGLAMAMEGVAKTARKLGALIPAEGIALLEEGARQLEGYLAELEDAGEVSPPEGIMAQLQAVADQLAGDAGERKASSE